MESSIFFGGSVPAAVVAGSIALVAPCCISVMLPAMAPAEGAELAQRGRIMFPPGILDGEAFSYGRLSERKLRNEPKRRAGSSA